MADHFELSETDPHFFYQVNACVFISMRTTNYCDIFYLHFSKFLRFEGCHEVLKQAPRF